MQCSANWSNEEVHHSRSMKRLRLISCDTDKQMVNNLDFWDNAYHNLGDSADHNLVLCC